MTAVEDTYNALTGDRPYRKGMAQEKALQIVEEVKGTQLCPDCVDVFLKYITTEDAYVPRRVTFKIPVSRVALYTLSLMVKRT